MASITKTKTGYRAQIYVLGVRDSGTFRTKREAEAWGAARDAELRATGELPSSKRYTLAEAMNRYADEVVPAKRGRRWDAIRIKALQDMPHFPMGRIGEITPEAIGAFRDARLKEVSAGTVLRELGLLSAILEHSRREWRWIPSNPCRDVRKPRDPDHREVIITRKQIRLMLESLGYRPGKPCRTVSQAVGAAFVLALRSGMRAGEITGLTWDRVFASHCYLPVTKTTPRAVPLSAKAVRVIEAMRGWDNELVFGVRSQTLDALFRKHRTRCGLSGFVFHDARHTAATWMAQKLDVLTLCKVFGWSNPKMAMVYFNPKASDIAKRL